MTKAILFVAVALVFLVGCDPKDSTPVVFQYNHYAYVVKVSPDTKLAGLVASEVPSLDEKGQLQTKTITESWSYLVLANKQRSCVSCIEHRLSLIILRYGW